MDKTITEGTPKSSKTRWNKAVYAYHKGNRTTTTRKPIKKMKKVKMKRFIKVVKPRSMFSAFKLVREADEALQKHDVLLEQIAAKWIARFEDRAAIVVENVNKVLGAVQAQMNAGKDPLQLAQGKEEDLINVLAGAKALELSGPQQASMALSSYLQKVKAGQQGLQPDQAEIQAIKTAGASASNARQQVQQQLQAFSQASQQGNQQQMEQIKRDFAKTYGFYQQLLQKIQGAQQNRTPMAPGVPNHPAGNQSINPSKNPQGPPSKMATPPQTAPQGTPSGPTTIPTNR